MKYGLTEIVIFAACGALACVALISGQWAAVPAWAAAAIIQLRYMV